MRIIGLTGGIGMGKSTAAAAFRRARIPVYDADADVHRLYLKGGRAVPRIEQAFPGTVVDGAVDRARLRPVLQQPENLRRLEAIVHPLVRDEILRFIARARRHRAMAVVIDNPLLIEMGMADEMDQVVVVSAPLAVQVHRVLLRGRMTPEQVRAVIARQMPDAQKRRRADLVVRTGLSRNHTLRQLRPLIRSLRS
jgi:dephospho-CoA kinase